MASPIADGLPSDFFKGLGLPTPVTTPPAGLLSKIGAFAQVAGPWIQGGLVVLDLFAKSQAKSEAKKAARDSTAVKIKAEQPIEANVSVKIAYGTCATTGARGFIAINEGRSIPGMPSGLDSIGSIPFDSSRGGATITCNPKEFYLQQDVLSVGEIAGLIDMTADGRSVSKPWHENGLRGTSGSLTGTLAACWLPTYESASTFASGFSNQRTANSRFGGLSYVDMVAQMPDSKEGRYRVFRGRTPEPVYIIQGRMVRTMLNGAPTSIVTHTDNNAAVLLDYLTSPLYGPRLPDAQIDMASLQTYYTQCERALQDSTAAPDSIGDTAEIGDLLESMTAEERGEYETANPARQAEIVRNLRRRYGYASRGTVSGGSKAVKRSLGKIRWGAYNGLIDTALPFDDAVEQIIQSVPGCEVVSTFGDKLRVSAPDWRQSAAQQSVATLEGDDILSEPPQLFDPDPEGRYNRYEGTYSNIDEDFHENTEAWDDPDLLEDDDGEVIEFEERVPGICTAIQMRTLARSRCLVSRRRVLRGRYNYFALGRAVGKGLHIIERNQVFRTVHRGAGIDGYFLMQSFRFDADSATCQFEAVEFNPLDYGPVLAARHTEFEQDEEPLSTGAFIRVAGVPEHAIPGGTTLGITASVKGTAQAAVIAFEGTGVANTAGGTTDWTPTADGNTLTVKATIGDCELTAMVTVEVGGAGDPTAEIVARGDGTYTAIGNGFDTTPTVAWDDAAPSVAGDLSSKTASVVTLSGGVDNVRGEIRVRLTAGDQVADDVILIPYLPTVPDHGGANTVDGEQRVI